MASHSSTFAWKIPWMEELGRLQSMGSLGVGHDWTSSLSLEKEMATHSYVLAWRIPGTGQPGGLPSMRSHRVGHDWSDLTAVAAVLKIQPQIVFFKSVQFQRWFLPNFLAKQNFSLISTFLERIKWGSFPKAHITLNPTQVKSA